MQSLPPDLSKLSRADKLEAIGILEELDRRRAAKDPIFFIKNYLMTFDPRPDVDKHDMPFDLYEFQEETVLELVEAIDEGFDAFVEKSRDMGLSWTALAVIFWCWLFKDGFQALIGSRKEDYVDNGTLDSLFGKFDYFIRTIKDTALLPTGFNIKVNRTYMKLINPVNGNTIKGESANKNFSRGGRYAIVLFDEFGFWPDARNSWTAAGDATKCRLAITTPPDEPSFAKSVRFSGKCKIITLHWRRHPKKDDDWYAYEKSRRTEEEVLHEIDISWEYSSSGRPYPEIDKVEIGRFGYDPKSPVYASIDLGLDAIAVGWYQPVPNTDWITLLDAYEVSNTEIEWFIPMFGKDINPRFTYNDKDLAFIEMVKYWQPPILYGDPSGNQRHVESGFSAYSILEAQGIPVQVNTKENGWQPRRDAAKMMMRKLRVNDTERTRWFLECIKSARYPKRDPETSQATSPIVKPVHDWTSHHRTQFEFFSVNYQPKFGFEEDEVGEAAIASLIY